MPGPQKAVRRQTKAAQAASALLDQSGVALALLPLGFEFEDRLPVAGLNLRHVRLLWNRRPPADRITDESLVLGAHGDGAVGAERRLDLQPAHRLRNLLAVCGARLLGRFRQQP